MRGLTTRTTSLNGKIIGDSIFMPANQPAKLNIPVSDMNRYEFTIRPTETISRFEERVLTNCSEISDFKIKSEAESLGDLAKDSFKIAVNQKEYTVYPDFESVLRSNIDHKDPLRVKTDKLKEENVSIKSAQKLAIIYFYRNFMKTQAQNPKTSYTKQEFENMVLEAAKSMGTKNSDAAKFAHITEYIDGLKRD